MLKPKKKKRKPSKKWGINGKHVYYKDIHIINFHISINWELFVKEFFNLNDYYGKRKK